MRRDDNQDERRESWLIGVDDETTVTDEIRYEGLEPGRTYSMHDQLVEKDSGEVVNETEINIETKEWPQTQKRDAVCAST